MNNMTMTVSLGEMLQHARRSALQNAKKDRQLDLEPANDDHEPFRPALPAEPGVSVISVILGEQLGTELGFELGEPVLPAVLCIDREVQR